MQMDLTLGELARLMELVFICQVPAGPFARLYSSETMSIISEVAI